jgi:hypothetical protein
MTHDSEVDRLLAGSTHPMTPGVQRLRSAVLDADPAITEHVKWRSPSFRYDGEDRMTVNLARPDRVVLVFHRGARVRPDAARFRFDDPTGLLTWPSPDRGLLTFTVAAEFEAALPAVVDLVGRWVRV